MKSTTKTDPSITLDDIGQLRTLQEIQGAPTDHVGQFADLKIEEYADTPDGRLVLVRYWLNRCGLADGETHRVDVEARNCPNGSWQDVGKLYPFGREEANA